MMNEAVWKEYTDFDSVAAAKYDALPVMLAWLLAAGCRLPTWERSTRSQVHLHSLTVHIVVAEKWIILSGSSLHCRRAV